MKSVFWGPKNGLFALGFPFKPRNKGYTNPKRRRATFVLRQPGNLELFGALKRGDQFRAEIVGG